MNNFIKNKKRVMLIGTGFGAQHADWISQSNYLDVSVVVYKNSKSRALDIANKHKIKNITPNPHEYMDDRFVDIVCIVSPPSTHEELITHAIKKKLVVVSDKPLTDSISSADILYKSWKKLEATVYFMFQWRSHPALKIILSILGSNEYDFKDIDISFNHNFLSNTVTPWTWRHNGGLGTGALSDLGAHIIDLLLYCLPEKWSVVSSDLEISQNQREFHGSLINCSSEDSAYFTLKSLKTNKVARLSCNRSFAGNPEITINFSGDNEKLSTKIDPSTYDFSLILEKNGKTIMDKKSIVSSRNFNPYINIESALIGSRNNDRTVADLGDAYNVQKIVSNIVDNPFKK